MKTNIKYWINNLEGNNNKIQPHSEEEQAAYDIAEYFVSCEKKEKVA